MGKINKAKKLAVKSYTVIRKEGHKSFIKATSRFIYFKAFPDRKKQYLKDILFVNGCTLPHPERYRVSHQMEQLNAASVSTDSIFYEQLTLEMIDYYRGFVFFRCPVTDTVEQFIQKAKQRNKTCFFDIDDLVIDTKYTDKIEFVSNMSEEDKKHYDDGVNRMKRTLELCDHVITTTEVLKDELKNYKKSVFVNRNVASDEMVFHANNAMLDRIKEDGIITIGYFSGSITHNPDFELVLPALLKVMEEFPQVHLKVAGIIDIPNKLKKYSDRVSAVGFMDWRELPKELALCDINIAPVEDTIFNQAKSENKWTEASLVKVVTIASNIGAFKDCIDHKNTGYLAKDNEWYEGLKFLIKHPVERLAMASRAYEKVISSHITINSGLSLKKFLLSNMSENIGFVLPSRDVSGGVNVVLKHAEILNNNGYDVTIISLEQITKTNIVSIDQNNKISQIVAHKTWFNGHFDNLVGTLWSTMKFVKKYPFVSNRKYFVQNYETDFYKYGNVARTMANATYNDSDDSIQYLTMSLWCKDWLLKRFEKKAKYASNGIDLDRFKPHKRTIKQNKKIKILIEGDSKDHYKNVDESFEIVQSLDKNKYDITYLSYRSAPKANYRVDTFHNRVPYKDVGNIYASCDILIKSSLLESFSYPPLEMMATGGYAVVVKNDGNVEYLKDKDNCLFYEQGNIDDAVQKINNLVSDQKLQSLLYQNGLKTAENYSWKNIEKDIVELYKS